jgi:hypothetical protein
MAGVEAPLMVACQAREGGEIGGRRRGAGGRAWVGMGWLLGRGVPGGRAKHGLPLGAMCCSRAC